MSNKHPVLSSDRAFPELAEEITTMLETNLVPTRAPTHVNSEIYVRLEESVRGYDAFVTQSHTVPVNEWITGQLIMADVLKRAFMKRITIVAPFYPYARQDKKHLGREPISARLVADFYKAAGADRIMSVDPHASQIQGFLDGPVDHLQGLPTLSDYIRRHYDISEMCVVSSDVGRVRLADMWTDELGCPLAIIRKHRDRETANTVAVHGAVGDVRGKTCILVDDMIDTAGTTTQAVLALQERGTSRVIRAATHAVFSGPVVEWLNKSGMAEVIVTNVLPIRTAEPTDNLTVLLIAPLIMRAINAVFRGGSVTSLLGGQVYK